MNYALIFAGGTGLRMNTRAKPKQFLELHGKPIIIYTLEYFQEHPEVDGIVVVCIESWIETLRHLLQHYNMSKVLRVVPGGGGGDESIYYGLETLGNICSGDDIILIHDGVRPLISGELISENIATVKKYGVAVTVDAATESVVRISKDGLIVSVPPRHEMCMAKAPQTFKYDMIWDLYKRARNDGLHPVDSASLCAAYGVEMHTVKSTPNNVKITTPQDYYIFRALFEAMENQQILGI